MSERNDHDGDRPEAPATTDEQEEIARHDRGTGGDAPAAGSIAEREALAEDDEGEPFGDEDAG